MLVNGSYLLIREIFQRIKRLVCVIGTHPIVFPEHHPEEYDEDDAVAALRRDAKTWGDIDEGMWTADEDDRVVSAFKTLGPKWRAISSLAQGKTKAQVRCRLAKLLLPGAARKIDCIDASSSWRAVNRRRVPG